MMKKILVIISTVIVLFYAIWGALAYYDKTINYQQTVEQCKNYLTEHNTSAMYALLSSNLQEQYSPKDMEQLIGKKPQNEPVSFLVTRISSSDNFNVVATYETHKKVFSFGGGWGRGWKITAIRGV